MKKLLFFFIAAFLWNCSLNKKPIFIKVDNIKLESIISDTLKLSANAFFKNPNDIGGKIATDSLNVFMNGTEVARVSSDEFEVPPREEFSIPLTVVVPTKEVFENNKNGILGGLLNSLINKNIKVQFKGNLRYKVLGFSHVYPIDKTEDIKITF